MADDGPSGVFPVPEPKGVPAIVLAGGCFGTLEGKVAHGLVRGGDRFTVRAVVDHTLAGRDAGELVTGIATGVPIVSTVSEAMMCAADATVAVVGYAPHGGRLTAELRELLRECAAEGLDLVSGLHDYLSDDPELEDLVASKGSTITDVRRPPPPSRLRFWDGSVHSVRSTRVAVLGTDCGVGKRTTARLLTAELNSRGLTSELIYTGQTGWMQGGRYGIIFDSLMVDFAAGELEGAILACAADVDPDVMVIEGQAAMRRPGCSGGSTLMLSAAVSGVILQHAPGRCWFDGLAGLPSCRIPALASEITLVEHFGVPVVAVALNLAEVAAGESHRVVAHCQADSGNRPVVDPVNDGVGAIAEAVAHLVPDRTR